MSTDRGAGPATKPREDGSPMEFNPYSDSFFDDPYETYRWMRDEAPVYYSERWDFYALTRNEDVVAAHRDWETFSSAYGVTLDALSMRHRFDELKMLIVMDPPEHELLRKLVRQVFTKAAIANLEPLVSEVVTTYVDALSGRDNFDIVADFAALFPVEIISSMLGVPPGERQQIRHWTDGFLHREPNNPFATESGVADSMAMNAYFLELSKEKRRQPDDLIISRLVDATYEDDTGMTHRLTDEDIATFAVLIAAAGSETVTKLIGNGTMALHHNPDQWELVLADPGLIPGAIEEMLRLNPPSQYQGRFTTREVVLDGGTIPAGSPTLLVTGAATRDPRAYDKPDAFDIRRGGSTTLAFGYGAHSCLGSWLARLETRVAWHAIRERWPRFTVDTDGLRRVTMSNVAGYSHIPVHVG
ncbi:cytochrome P450 [Mycobacterium senriense]|uniref:Cytochrome P450 n=1 Tax=Mycobacterium senriense TaxID=2775496 RepID=A0ABN6IFC7_9MYCO|nr:cytochrome P450 [Mycobacterium senriense]BCZ21758.1 cytochrome P450 [Mycobacterium senriense]